MARRENVHVRRKKPGKVAKRTREGHVKPLRIEQIEQEDVNMTNNCNIASCRFWSDEMCMNQEQQRQCLQVFRDVVPNPRDREELLEEVQEINTDTV